MNDTNVFGVLVRHSDMLATINYHLIALWVVIAILVWKLRKISKQ